MQDRSHQRRPALQATAAVPKLISSGPAQGPSGPTTGVSLAQRVTTLLARARALGQQTARHIVSGDAEALERDSRQLHAVALELHGALAPLQGRLVADGVALALKREFSSLLDEMARQREQALRRKSWVDRRTSVLMGAGRESTYRVDGAVPRH